MRGKIFLPIATLLVVILIGCVFVLFSKGGSPATHSVVLTEEGYSPSTITIKKGDTIVFSTKLNKPHWPASNIHPTHGIYPEFDPQDAIMPDKTWSFTFQKEGQWAFHDHLAPYYTGKVIVSK